MSDGYNKTVVAAYYLSEGLPKPVFEFCFFEGRKWRFDICFPDHRVAIEVQGGLFANKKGVVGAHARGAALLKEYEKANYAAASGWLLLHAIPKDVATQEIVRLIRAAMAHTRLV